MKCAVTCIFCAEFADPPDAPHRKMWSDEHFVILPTIGAITPGYSLLMPQVHVPAFSYLPHALLEDAFSHAERLRKLIMRRFCTDVIIAEHGMGEGGTRSVGCCDHAHFHFIPTQASRVIEAYEKAGGAPIIHRTAIELADWKHRPYMYLSPMPYAHWTWAVSTCFTSQFVRSICAEIAGVPDLWDWAVHPFVENQLLTRIYLEDDLRDFGRVAA